MKKLINWQFYARYYFQLVRRVKTQNKLIIFIL